MHFDSVTIITICSVLYAALCEFLANSDKYKSNSLLQLVKNILAVIAKKPASV